MFLERQDILELQQKKISQMHYQMIFGSYRTLNNDYQENTGSVDNIIMYVHTYIYWYEHRENARDQP
jgi:hypothetical protein